MLRKLLVELIKHYVLKADSHEHISRIISQLNLDELAKGLREVRKQIDQGKIIV